MGSHVICSDIECLWRERSDELEKVERLVLCDMLNRRGTMLLEILGQRVDERLD